MTKCKNNPQRTYEGTEPSPKGLGYCASGEKEGVKMKGKDGNMWIKKGGRWIKYNICDDFVEYDVKVSKHATQLLQGLKSEKEGYIYKWIDYNKFEEKLTKVPKNAKLFKHNKNRIEKFFCGSKKLPQDIKDTGIHKDCKKYLTHDNGGRPFLVCIKNKDVLIYKIPDTIYIGKDIKDYHYTDLIKKYNVEKIFIGKSPLNYMTKFSGGHGPKFDGNSILLQLKDKYVFIGETIYEFKPQDEIVKYWSPVGNNDVPYPFAIGKDYVYFMLDRDYIPIKYIEDINNVDKTDLYTYFYGHEGDEALNKYAKKMVGIKEIQKRLRG